MSERCNFYAREPHGCSDHGTLYTPRLCGKAADALLEQRDTALAALEKERGRAQRLADERAGFKDVAQSLESRYRDLVNAAQKLQRDGAWYGSYVFGEDDQKPERFHVMKDDAMRLFATLDALAAALTPKEGE